MLQEEQMVLEKLNVMATPKVLELEKLNLVELELELEVDFDLNLVRDEFE